MNNAWIALALVAACGSKGDDAGKASSPSADTTVTATVDKVAFSLQLPAHWKADDADSNDAVKAYLPDVQDFTTAPNVEIRKQSPVPKDPAALIATAGLDDRYDYKRKEATGDVVIVSAHAKDNSTAEVDLVRIKGDTSLWCRIFQVDKQKGVPETQLAVFEKICQSLMFK